MDGRNTARRHRFKPSDQTNTIAAHNITHNLHRFLACASNASLLISSPLPLILPFLLLRLLPHNPSPSTSPPTTS